MFAVLRVRDPIVCKVYYLKYVMWCQKSMQITCRGSEAPRHTELTQVSATNNSSKTNREGET